MAEYLDRFDAGQQLARGLESLRGQDVVVLGLARGGVPVADVVARFLDAPMDVLVARKLGVPIHPELAMGAIAEQGTRTLDEQIIDRLGITPEQVAAVEQKEHTVLQERAARYREGREPVDVTGRTVVVVDDGMATGATARVACLTARRRGAARVVVAVPVASRQAVDGLVEAHDIVALSTPRDFRAVGLHYQSFSQTTDDQVVMILDEAARRRRGGQPDDTEDPPRTRVNQASEDQDRQE